jgi:site-specific recombinase XerD
MKNALAREQCSSARGVIAAYIQMYLKHLGTRNYSERTIDVYARALCDLDRFLSSCCVERMEDISADTLERFRLHLIERGFMPESQGTYLRAVRGMFRLLSEKHLIFINPANAIKTRAVPRRIRHVPSENDMRRLLGAVDLSRATGVRDRALLEVAYGSGLRRGELASLSLPAVDLSDARLRVMGKGRQERIVPLTSMAVHMLGVYIRDARSKLYDQDTDCLWVGRCGAFDANAVSAVFYSVSMRAGIDPVIRPHAVRRACATHMLRRGASPIDIQHLLGHSSLRHLGQYLAVSITELRQIHAACNPGR